jgi:hypothetical protein
MNSAAFKLAVNAERQYQFILNRRQRIIDAHGEEMYRGVLADYCARREKAIRHWCGRTATIPEREAVHRAAT